MTAAAPDIADLLPHRPPMRLLDELLDHDGARVRCATTWSTDSPLGRASSVVALELMAQCAAVHAGLQARAAQLAPRVGYLVSCRALTLHADTLLDGQRYLVETHQTAASGSMHQYDGRVWTDDDAPVAEARFAVYLEPSEDVP